MRVAFVHDWLLGMRGGEKCLEALVEKYPDSEVFTAFLDRENLSKTLKQQKITPSRLNSLPGIKKVLQTSFTLLPLGCSRNFNKFS